MGCSTKQNVVLSRRTHHKHDTAPLSLYNRHTITLCLVSDHKNRGQKILLPSAVHLEERLTVSQAVPEPGQQSVRQKHTVWVFCQWQTRHQAVRTLLTRKSSSGRMVLQRSADFLVGGSNPGRVKLPPPPPPPPLQRVRRAGFEPPASIAASCCVTIRPAVAC